MTETWYSNHLQPNGDTNVLIILIKFKMAHWQPLQKNRPKSWTTVHHHLHLRDGITSLTETWYSHNMRPLEDANFFSTFWCDWKWLIGGHFCSGKMDLFLLKLLCFCLVLRDKSTIWLQLWQAARSVVQWMVEWRKHSFISKWPSGSHLCLESWLSILLPLPIS